jgi:hypothetical protein
MFWALAPVICVNRFAPACRWQQYYFRDVEAAMFPSSICIVPDRDVLLSCQERQKSAAQKNEVRGLPRQFFLIILYVWDIDLDNFFLTHQF